ncbi:MAG: sialidase family protein [Promethearchaeota archaeon]
MNIFYLRKYLVLIIVLFLFCINNGDLNNRQTDFLENGNSPNKDTQTPIISAEEFCLISEFEPSSYFISPDSSLGSKDGVYFSFMTNKDGNYSLTIENFPTEITDTINYETSPSFDNPNGTNYYYIAFIDLDINNLSFIKLKVLISNDGGNSWQEKTVARLSPGDNEDIYKAINLIRGTAIAANPYTGIVGILTFYNFSELVYFGSKDNGLTWNPPITIANVSEIGCTNKMDWKGEFALPEIGILKNGTIIAISEGGDPNTADLRYMISNDNGTTWTKPKNITITENIKCGKPKFQADWMTGNYYLAFRNENNWPPTVSWAEYRPFQNLSSPVVVKNVSKVLEGNFDFIWDVNSKNFRIIEVKSTEIINLTTPNFLTSWTNTSFGNIKPITETQSGDSDFFNIAYDGEVYRYFFAEDYLGNMDIFQYYNFKNNTFWKNKGTFLKNNYNQIFWDGKINKTKKVFSSRVKVNFIAQNGTSTLERNLYISIDNNEPIFENFNQRLNYFNPLSSND